MGRRYTMATQPLTHCPLTGLAPKEEDGEMLNAR